MIQIMGRSGMGRIFPLALVTAVFFAAAPVMAGDDEDEDEKPPPDFVMKDTGKSDWAMMSHTKHGNKVPRCSSCHPKVFSSKLGLTKETKGGMTMEAMEKGAFCGVCHNGKESFDVTVKEYCVKCHSVKKE